MKKTKPTGLENQHLKKKTLNRDDGLRPPREYLHLALKDKRT